MNRFVIISCGYNEHHLMKMCVESVQRQTYDNYIHVIVDDASEYNMFKYCLYDEHNIFYRNNKNMGKCYNFYTYLNDLNLDDEDIIVELDLDDLLYHKDVLFNLNKYYYSDPNIWITYSIYYDTALDKYVGESYPQYILKRRSFRSYEWLYSHLRTYKYKLFKNIKEEDLKIYGKWINAACDQAIAFPMLEMAGEKHIQFIGDRYQIIYTNNKDNAHKRFGLDYQKHMSDLIRQKPKYSLLEL